MKKINLYIAGKVSKDSVFGTHDWRSEFCKQLSQLAGTKISNFDPTKSCGDYPLNENDSKLVFGRDCYMISRSDLVVVYLTDDISVGGSQEMIIAKYYKKPLLGIAPREGKFCQSNKHLFGRNYKDWVHPFVGATCDYVANDIGSAAEIIKKVAKVKNVKAKDLAILKEAVQYYKKEYLQFDSCIFS